MMQWIMERGNFSLVLNRQILKVYLLQVFDMFFGT